MGGVELGPEIGQGGVEVGEEGDGARGIVAAAVFQEQSGLWV